MDEQNRIDKAVELATANFEALGVLEEDGKLYLPTTIKRRNVRGGIDAEPILLTVPTNAQLDRARIQSRKLATERGLDIEPRPGGIEAPDHDKLGEIENYCILTFAIRDPQTRAQLEPTPGDLYDRFSSTSLSEVWVRFQTWCDLVDPRFGEMNADQLWQVVAKIALEGNMLPLSGMHGFSQATCIVAMARAACESPNAPSWLNLPLTSAPDD